MMRWWWSWTCNMVETGVPSLLHTTSSRGVSTSQVTARHSNHDFVVESGGALLLSNEILFVPG